jgi:hypothetical protein
MSPIADKPETSVAAQKALIRLTVIASHERRLHLYRSMVEARRRR